MRKEKKLLKGFRAYDWGGWVVQTYKIIITKERKVTTTEGIPQDMYPIKVNSSHYIETPLKDMAEPSIIKDMEKSLRFEPLK